MTAPSLTSAGRALPGWLVGPEPLRWHAALAASAASAAALANVLWSPDRIWAPWLALVLGGMLAAHGWAVLARALRPAGPPRRLSVAPAPEREVATSADRLDPGPPIFPDTPAAPPRRWIPRRLDEPAPPPRIAAFPAPALHPLPARWLEDVEVAPVRQAPSWPTWEPRPAADGWASDEVLAGEPLAEPAPTLSGW